jgi:hypothetical protein
MLFRETVYVYCENHTEHINTLSDEKFLFAISDGTYSYHCVSKLYVWINLKWLYMV